MLRCALEHIASLLLAVAVLLSATGLARAEQDPGTSGKDGTERARRLFDRGLELSRQERWGEALELFRRSRKLAERAPTVFNIATALARLGRSQAALEALDDFMELADSDEHGDAIVQAGRLRRELEQSFGKLQLRVRPPDARVSVDGKATGTRGARRSVVLDPGTHRVTVRAEGYEHRRFEVSVLAGERRTRQIELRPRNVVLQIESDIDAAQIAVDDERVGRGRARVQLVPGIHRVRVDAEGHDPFRKELRLAPGQQMSLRAELEEPLYRKPLLWVLVGAAAAGTVAAIGFATGAFLPEEKPYGGTADFTLTALKAAGGR